MRSFPQSHPYVVDHHYQVNVHRRLEKDRLLLDNLVGLTDERHYLLPFLVKVVQSQLLNLEVGFLLKSDVNVALQVDDILPGYQIYIAERVPYCAHELCLAYQSRWRAKSRCSALVF